MLYLLLLPQARAMFAMWEVTQRTYTNWNYTPTRKWEERENVRGRQPALVHYKRAWNQI